MKDIDNKIRNTAIFTPRLSVAFVVIDSRMHGIHAAKYQCKVMQLIYHYQDLAFVVLI